MKTCHVLLTALLMSCVTFTVLGADVTLVKDGQALVAINVDAGVMAVDTNVHAPSGNITAAETERRQLREAVKDLALYLGRISGAKVEIIQRAPQDGDKLVPILIGSLAVKQFGESTEKSRCKQGWRMTITDKAIGLSGQSDQSASYAIYELLERLGCRWYLPGEWGECIPEAKTIALPAQDVSGKPGTEGRVIWYADDAFKRRTRQGGDAFNGGHALELNENYVTKAQLAEHPDWVGQKDGKPLPNRFCWANQGLRDAVAAGVIARLDKEPARSISIGPDDGCDFCSCPKCLALDAGDHDATMNCVSITDRFISFANAVGAKVAQKYPDTTLAFLAYVQYTRPPVREKLLPNLAPVIAPITYCRAHAMTDTNCPSRQSIRPVVEGWGKAARTVSYYNYMFHLAEVTVPYPMMHQMSEELPILYANNVTVWSPETMPNFDSVLPGFVLAVRMSVNPKLKPAEVLDEFFTRFYGAAVEPMRRYWQTFDDAWNQVPEHAGCLFGYPQRFTPEVMKKAREAMNAALAACKTPSERQRVTLCDDALKQFELFMKLRWDLFDGKLANLDSDATAWFNQQVTLGDKYAAQYSFSAVGWTPKTPEGKSFTIGGQYFNIFCRPSYTDGSRIAKDFSIFTKPMRSWRYQVDKDKKGAELGWSKADFDDKNWKTTDPCMDTWFKMGLDGYYGPMWYRDTVKLPAIPAGKKVFVWVSSTDGKCKVFVNGQLAPYINAKGEKADEADGYCQAFSFDATAAVKPDAENQVTIIGTHVFLNELGTGGLLGPVLLYAEK